MLEIMLAIIIVLLAGIAYLLFKLLPAEEKKNITRQITPTKGQVMEWEAKQDEEDKLFRKVLKKIGL